jgi:hypothetical protein
LGRHAIPVAEEFVREMKAQCGTNQTFGDVMVKVRRKILGEKGLPMVLCLWAYGDADWRI